MTITTAAKSSLTVACYVFAELALGGKRVGIAGSQGSGWVAHAKDWCCHGNKSKLTTAAAAAAAKGQGRALYGVHYFVIPCGLFLYLSLGF